MCLAITSFLETFEYVPDPRVEGMVEYKLDEILLMSLSAIVYSLR